MKRFTILTLVAVCAMLSGCAAQIAKERANALSSSTAAVMSASSCCRSLAEFPYKEISIPFQSKTEIDRSAPAFDFPSGKSFFRAFKLPAYKSPYILEVTSRLSGPGPTVHGMWLFYPVLLFLDGSFKPTAVIRDLSFRFTSWPWIEPYGMQARLLMSEPARDARYVVVFTEPQFLSRSFDLRPGGGIVVPTGGGMMFVPSSSNVSVPFGYEGRVDIKVFHDETAP